MPAAKTAPTTDDRLTAVEAAVKTLTQRLCGPNGEGMEEAEALYATLFPAPEPEVAEEPEVPAAESDAAV